MQVHTDLKVKINMVKDCGFDGINDKIQFCTYLLSITVGLSTVQCLKYKIPADKFWPLHILSDGYFSVVLLILSNNF